MNQNDTLEIDLQALGAALQARPRLTDRVLDELRASSATGLADTPPDDLPAAAPRDAFLRRPLLAAAAGLMAMVGVGLSIAIMLIPSPSVGWADVTEAIQAQKWIRGKATYEDGKQSTVWLSPERQVWAFRLGDACYFFDGREKTKFEYRGDGATIVKLPLGEDDVQKVLPLDALSRDQSAVGPWLLLTEKILRQERREVAEEGKTWIEFEMLLSRGQMNQATLRVDPETRLPVHLRMTSPRDKSKSVTMQFDYPADGPQDIYALGAPGNIEIVDRMPAHDILRVLDAMAASRARIGDFRLIVGHPPAGRVGSAACVPGSVVYRKANRWRVDHCYPQFTPEPTAEAPKDRNWGEWFEEQLKINPPLPLLICDGKAVWTNSSFQPGEKPTWEVSPHSAPQDLMSGDGLGSLSFARYVKIASLLYPDLTPKPGWGFEIDRDPAGAPGRLLIKRSARLASVEPLVGHEWYYVDPAKGHAVSRVELFNLPPETPADPKSSKFRQTLLMEDFQQSPGGFWYARLLRDTSVAGPNGVQPTASTVRYHFDFDSDLPDSLFTVDGEAD